MSEPYDNHIPAKTLANLANEEVYHGISHANADDRYGDAFVSTSDGRKATLGSKPKRFRRRVQVGCDTVSSTWRAYSHLYYDDAA